jgi:hypothetical protein
VSSPVVGSSAGEAGPMSADLAPSEAQPGAAPEAAAPALQDGVPIARKVVANATINLVIDDTEQIVTQLQGLIDEVGGYVANANLYKSTYGNDTRLQGTLTLRIPADELEHVMAQLETLAVEVNNKTINREDVTDQYSDIDAQLRNLEATEVELREMLAEVRAKPNARPEDILTVYDHLTTIRGQIEQLQGRKNVLDNLVAFSTLEVTLTPNFVTLPVIEEGWQPGVVARSAVRELVNTLQGLSNLAIWVGIYGLPILLIILLVVVALVWLLRSVLRRFTQRNTAAAR